MDKAIFNSKIQCFHSISFSCEKRQNKKAGRSLHDAVSIQLVSLARRDLGMKMVVVDSVPCFHSISFSCEKRQFSGDVSDISSCFHSISFSCEKRRSQDFK